MEAFGSTARGEAKRGSDVDLLATFASNPGLRFFTMEEEMAAILGVPVHLLTRDSVEQMSNPYRRESILADARGFIMAKPAPKSQDAYLHDMLEAARLIRSVAPGTESLMGQAVNRRQK